MADARSLIACNTLFMIVTRRSHANLRLIEPLTVPLPPACASRMKASCRGQYGRVTLPAHQYATVRVSLYKSSCIWHTSTQFPPPYDG